MKIFLYIVIGLFLIISIYFVALSVSARKQPELGMINGQLRACPASPNCVSSEQQGTGAFVEPLRVTSTVGDAWNKAKQAIVENGGEIMTERDGYLRAQFVTPLMRYIDDVELRIDEKQKVIHIRSASRVGHSDMGANRARVKKIRMAFLNNPGNGKY
jgi:uncharacterized protein (DUF1499 family)